MKLLLTLTLLFTLSASPSLAADNPVSGTWKVSGDVVGNPIDQVCTIKQDGDKLTGSCKVNDTDSDLTGEVTEKKVTWHYDTDYNGNKLTVTFSGTFDGSSEIKGDVEVQPYGVNGNFTAKKDK